MWQMPLLTELKNKCATNYKHFAPTELKALRFDQTTEFPNPVLLITPLRQTLSLPC